MSPLTVLLSDPYHNTLEELGGHGLPPKTRKDDIALKQNNPRQHGRDQVGSRRDVIAIFSEPVQRFRVFG